jgi:peptide/nickel transport system permease protein
MDLQGPSRVIDPLLIGGMMFRYIARRLIYAIPVLIGILVVVFVLARLIPGDPCRAILGEKATEEACVRFNHEMGLDKPITVQFGIYITRFIQGDFGNSIRFSRPVSLILVERLPTTIELTLFALMIAIAIGVPADVGLLVRHPF